MSDGFAELKNQNQEMYGYKRARNSFEESAKKEPEEIITHLRAEARSWTSDKEPDDDVTFVVIKENDIHKIINGTDMKAKSIKGKSPEEIKNELAKSIADGFTPTLAIIFLSVNLNRDSIYEIFDEKGITIFRINCCRRIY